MGAQGVRRLLGREGMTVQGQRSHCCPKIFKSEKSWGWKGPLDITEMNPHAQGTQECVQVIWGCLQRGTQGCSRALPPPWEELFPAVEVELVVFDFLAIVAHPVTLNRAWPHPLAPLGDISMSLEGRGEYWGNINVQPSPTLPLASAGGSS